MKFYSLLAVLLVLSCSICNSKPIAQSTNPCIGLYLKWQCYITLDNFLWFGFSLSSKNIDQRIRGTEKNPGFRGYGY